MGMETVQGGGPRWGWLPGAAVGLLLGISAGLSSVPVIATIVAALTAGLLVLLGVKGSEGAAAEGFDRSAVGMRIGGFALVCALALVAGVAIRANDWLAPSPLKMQQRWTSAGFSDADAHAIVLYQKLGLSYNKGAKDEKGNDAATLMEAKEKGGAAGASSSLLFADKQGQCPFLDRSRYNSTDAMMESMSLQGEPLQRVAKSVTGLPAAKRDEVLGSIYGLVCAE